MKIIEAGKQDVKYWWVGVVLTCPKCNRKVELEKGDNANTAMMNMGPAGLTYCCETCGFQIDHLNEKNEKLIVEDNKEPLPTPPTPPKATFEPKPDEGNPHAARVGNKVTQGYSDPFSGTSWGIKP